MHFIDSILSFSAFPLLTALLLGIMTLISPCPFCSNVTALSYITQHAANKRLVLASALAYTLGKITSYTLLAIIFISGAQIEGVRHFFETYGEPCLGPFLIIIGVLIAILGYHEGHHDHDHSHAHNSEKWTDRLAHKLHLATTHSHNTTSHSATVPDVSTSVHPITATHAVHTTPLHFMGGAGGGSFLLGIIFALAFCPYSGVLYFGTLIPLSINLSANGSLLTAVMMPILYGIGDALPVLILALLLSYGLRSMSHLQHNMAKLEKILRWICVIIFIGVGLYMSIELFGGHHHHHDHDHHEHIEATLHH